MALLGFWDFSEQTSEFGSSVASKPYSLSPRTPGGSYASAGSYSDSAAPWEVYPAMAVPQGSTLVFGFAVHSLINVALREGTTSHLQVSQSPTTSQLVLSRGGTEIARSAPRTFFYNLWNYIEIKAVIDSVAGSVEVRCNNQTIINFAGNTRNGGTGIIDRGVSVIGYAGGAQWFADTYFLDASGPAPYNDFLGDIKVSTLLPVAAGAVSGWVGSDGNSVDNHLLVDEVMPSGVDYVGAAAAGLDDFYQMADLVPSPAPIGSVFATRLNASQAKSDAGVSPLVVLVEEDADGTQRPTSPMPAPTTGFTLYPTAEIRTTDPDGIPWTPTSLNATQVGVRSV